MKVNANRCHLQITGNYKASANINKFETESGKKEELLGISIDTRLSFGELITSLCKKSWSKVACACKNNTLSGLRKTKILNERIFDIPI